MDIQRAIAKIDPKARYLLNHSQADDAQKILEWRGPGIMPTESMIRDAWQLCLDDDAETARLEAERLLAVERVKASPTLADVAKVLRL